MHDRSHDDWLSFDVYGSAVNKQFLWFFIPVLLFYMAWQLDWGMWYIGQTQYLGLDESSLSIYSGIFNIGQLLAIGVFSRVVQKKGNDFSICFAGFGLAMCPLIMIVTYLIPVAWHMPALSILTTVLNAGQCTVNLCIVQILLRVVPEKGRSLVISLYTLVLTVSNSFMPTVGVSLYTALGADTRGFIQFFLIVAALRLVCLGIFIVRYHYLKWVHMSD